MRINCTYKEMLDYTKNYGGIDHGGLYAPGTPGTKLRNTWLFVQNMNEFLKQPQDFHVVIETRPDVRGFKQLVFTFDKPINTPARLAHYLHSFDSYMLKNYPNNYQSLFREYPDWWLLWCFLERAMTYNGSQFQPIIITVKGDLFDLEQPIPAEDSCNTEPEHVWSA